MRLWRPQLSPRSSAQRRFARSHWLRADLVVARPPRKRSVWIWLPPLQQVLQCYDIPLAPDLNKARNVQTLPERRHKCSAPASDELRKNPIIGIVWLLRPGLRRCDPRYLNEVRFTPWLSLWRSSREILNHGCKSLRSDFHRAGERMIDDHNGQQPGKDQD